MDDNASGNFSTGSIQSDRSPEIYWTPGAVGVDYFWSFVHTSHKKNDKDSPGYSDVQFHKVSSSDWFMFSLWMGKKDTPWSLIPASL